MLLVHFQSCRASSHINVKCWSPPTKAEVPKEVAANLKECDVIGRDVLSAFVARVEDGVAARVRHEPVDRRTQRAWTAPSSSSCSASDVRVSQIFQALFSFQNPKTFFLLWVTFTIYRYDVRFAKCYHSLTINNPKLSSEQRQITCNSENESGLLRFFKMPL